MVSIAVSKMGMTELLFVVPGMKVSVLLRCFTLLADAASDRGCCRR